MIVRTFMITRTRTLTRTHAICSSNRLLTFRLFQYETHVPKFFTDHDKINALNFLTCSCRYPQIKRAPGFTLYARMHVPPCACSQCCLLRCQKCEECIQRASYDFQSQMLMDVGYYHLCSRDLRLMHPEHAREERRRRHHMTRSSEVQSRSEGTDSRHADPHPGESSPPSQRRRSRSISPHADPQHRESSPSSQRPHSRSISPHADPPTRESSPSSLLSVGVQEET